MKVVRLSALRTGRLYSPGYIPGTHSCYRLSRPQDHRVAERVMSLKNSKDTIENRIHDFQACSAVPQPTAPPRAPIWVSTWSKIRARLPKSVGTATISYFFSSHRMETVIYWIDSIWFYVTLTATFFVYILPSCTSEDYINLHIRRTKKYARINIPTKKYFLEKMPVNITYTGIRNTAV